ncbi:AraC family transcriptional regulator [Vreelandella venusta]|uniref:AraC family transcriptional regulator n=1 Tax=Vreelandella venusta TaxID=44935 RepID=UPI002285794B|nr:AraC family transcriptional regulator [Halomonas venusta]WAM49991.1 AraC family transcriptional regulator [Halomonas venusta]
MSYKSPGAESLSAKSPSAKSLDAKSRSAKSLQAGPPPVFWRDSRLPYVELRKISDARQVCYAPHSHVHWSVGAITSGSSTFFYRESTYPINAGDLVMMNPDWVHACNPIENEPWAYLMLYVDAQWLADVRYQIGTLGSPDWSDIDTAVVSQPALYAHYCEMAACLLDKQCTLSMKHASVTGFLTALMLALAHETTVSRPQPPDGLQAAAAYCDVNAAFDVSLETLCQLTGYSAGHLIRAFKQHYGLTPHAYLINRRVQLGQRALRQGESIVNAALLAGFNDQPHFQRTFKRLVAATPNQYRYPLLKQQENSAGS